MVSPNGANPCLHDTPLQDRFDFHIPDRASVGQVEGEKARSPLPAAMTVKAG